MHALDLLLDPRRLDDRPIYVLVGDDAYLGRESLAAIARVVLGPEDADDELAVRRFSGDTAALAEVLDEVRTLPFLLRRRVVVVEGADPFITAHRRALESYAERPSTRGVLVLAVRSWPGTTRLAKLVERNGRAIDCKPPAERELLLWLKRLAERRAGTKLDDDAARLVLELAGPETGVLATEIAKLGAAVAPRGRITVEDVARNVGAGRLETIWNILEAATTGRAAAALNALDRLVRAGEHPVGLLAAMTASLRKIHHAGQLRKARVEAAEACRIAGVPNYRGAIDLTLRQHAHLGPSRVGQLPDLLLRADQELKGGSSMPPRVVLERLLVRLALPRRD